MAVLPILNPIYPVNVRRIPDAKSNPPAEPVTTDPDALVDNAGADGLPGVSGDGIANPSVGGSTPTLPPGSTIPSAGRSNPVNAGGGCMIAANIPSPMAANLEDPVNEFHFDYFIESIARIGYTETDGRRVDQAIKMNYYVNSNDGSMFFDTGMGGFFGANSRTTRNRMGRIDGPLWKADGQMIHYGLDNATGALRAVVVEQDQSATNVTGQETNECGYLYPKYGFHGPES